MEIPLKLPAQQGRKFPELAGCQALIMDDDRESCESIALILGEIGIRAKWVLSGREAVQQVWQAHEMNDDYFAVIIHRRMSGMDGLETARQLRARLGSEKPFLLLCASDCESVKDEAVAAGIDGFLTRPIFKSSLLEQLQNYMQGGKGRAQSQARDGTADLEGVRILAAEDNELNLEIIMELLESSGAAVDSARNGKEAVDRYLNSSPGYYRLILMDVHMPEMDGLEATMAIRSSGRPDAAAVPVVAMTADVFKEDIRKCLNAGMNAHIGKPLELDKLFDTLQRLLNGAREPEGEIG